MFKVEIIGNIGADAEVKNYQGGKFVTFRCAHSSKYKDSNGNEVDDVVWIDVTMNDTESKLIPFLKRGTKVFVRGNASLRCYSSPKLKRMVAGLSVSAWEVELCGGSSDEVPRQLIDPSNGAIVDVSKHYWCNHPTEGMKENDYVQLIDKQGREFIMNYGGFVQPVDVVDGDNTQQGAEQATESAQTEQTPSADTESTKKNNSRSRAK